MSNIFRSQKLDEDFENFQNKLSEASEVVFKINTSNKSHLKKFHRVTYSLALIEFKLEEKYTENNKYFFLKEIISDLLCISSLSFLGFYSSSQILLRRVLENFYNHIYYFDHPIEYILVDLGRNEYVPMLQLKNYFDTHPVVKSLKDSNLTVYNANIFAAYHELCKIVHTKGEDFMGLAQNLQEVKVSFDVADYFKFLNDTISPILYLLFKFHNDIKYTHIEKDIIVKVFPRDVRHQLLG